MWRSIISLLYILIYTRGQEYHHLEDDDHYDYSISIDSDALYGLRRPDGLHNEDIVCFEGSEVHIDGVWFGYQDYQKIPVCHQDKLSQPCLFNLTSSPLDCQDSSCKFPNLSDNDDIPPACRSGLRYWHVCYSCVDTELELAPGLAHVSEGEPAAEYEEYYYYDYDYETPHTTYRFDVDGNEDLVCESEHHHLVVESVKYGFDKEVIKNHKFEDGDSDCVFDFTNEFVHMLCTRTQCKSPMLKELKKYNVGKNCKEKALLGMWEIIYICQENQDSQYDDVEDSVESHDEMDEESVESEDNLVEKDYVNSDMSEIGEILDPSSIETESKSEPKEVEDIMKHKDKESSPVKVEKEVNPNAIIVEIAEEKDKIALKDDGEKDPVNLRSEDSLYPQEIKKKEEISINGNLDLVEINDEKILDQGGPGDRKKIEPVDVIDIQKLEFENEDELLSKEEERQKKIDQVEPIKVPPEVVINEKAEIHSMEIDKEIKPIEENSKTKAAELDQVQDKNVEIEDRIDLKMIENEDKQNFNKNIFNLDENQDKQLLNEVKTGDRHNSRPVVSQHLVNIEPNLSSVVPPIEIVSSTEKADKLESTSIKPMTAPTKASKQDIKQLQRNANINLVAATETPSIISEKSSYTKSDIMPHEQEKNDNKDESSGIFSWFNSKKKNKIDQTSTETPIWQKSDSNSGEKVTVHSNHILMDGHIVTTPQPKVTDRVVQKQLNRDHVSKQIEDATKSSTKRASKPTDATQIDRHIEMKQDKDIVVKEKNGGLLSWFSFSKTSNNEQDTPENGPSMEPDSKVTPIHLPKSQDTTTKLPTISEMKFDATKATDVEVAIIPGHDNFEKVRVSEIKNDNSIGSKDLIDFKAEHQIKKHPDDINIKRVDPVNEVKEISSSNEEIQQMITHTYPASVVISNQLIPEDTKKNKQENIELNPTLSDINHQRERMIQNDNQLEIDDKNDDHQDIGPIEPNFVIDDQKDEQQEHGRIDQVSAIIDKEKVKHIEKHTFKSFEPGMKEIPEQLFRHQHENEQKDPNILSGPNSVKKFQEVHNVQEQKDIDLIFVDQSILSVRTKEINDQTKIHKVTENLVNNAKVDPKYSFRITTVQPKRNGNQQNNINNDSVPNKDAIRRINNELSPEQNEPMSNSFGLRNKLKEEIIGHEERNAPNKEILALDEQSTEKVGVLLTNKTQMANNDKHHISSKNENPESLLNPSQPKPVKKLQNKSKDQMVAVTARPSLAPIRPVTIRPSIIYSKDESGIEEPVKEIVYTAETSLEIIDNKNKHKESQNDLEYASIDPKPLPTDEADPTLPTISALPTLYPLPTLKNEVKENIHKKVNRPTDQIEGKIVFKTYVDGQKDHEQNLLHAMSRQNMTDNLPELKISINKTIINSTSRESSPSLIDEKPNFVNILKKKPDSNFTQSDFIEILDIPLETHKTVPTQGPIFEHSRTTSIPVTGTPDAIQVKFSTKPTVTMTTQQNVPTVNNVNILKADLPTTKWTIKPSTLPTTIINEVTTTSKPNKKDFSTSNATSFLPSKQKTSDSILSSIEDTNNEEQYNENDFKQYDTYENVQHQNLAKDISPKLRGDNEIQEEDASVKVSWFSTTPDDFHSETEKDIPEITTEVYTEIDVIVGDLLYGDNDISFDQTKLLSSNVKIDQVEILHFVEETEREIASDIDHLKHDLDNLLDLDDESMQDFPEIVQEIAKERVENFFKSMSASMKKVKLGSILQGPKAMSHTTEDLKPSEETNAASNLLNVTADISKKLSKTLHIGSEIDIDLPDIKMTVRKKSLSTNSSSRWESKAVEVNLPDQESIAGEDSTITVSFTAYDNLGSMMTLNEDFSSSVLSINVIGVEGAEKSIKLTKPLNFKLAHNPLTKEEQRSCVYWDFANSSWSDEGCSPILTTSSINSTTCECHHLTNFAILIDMHGIASHEDHKPFLDILTNIGCLISMTGLILCILIYSTFRSAKNERSTINVNLCMCLLLSELIFMFGIGQTHSPGLCAVISAILHYIFLASFFWMLIAGFQIYVLLVEVFEVDGSRFVHYYLLGYIAPLIIVLFSLLFDTLLNDVSIYGTDKYCWMSYGLHLGISFLCPLSLVMTANLYFLVVAFHKFHVHSMDMIRLKSRKSSIKTYLNGLFGLLFLLGVSWSIGLISLIYPSVVLSYTFTVLNSLQGFFIFFFNCIGNNKIRNESRRKVHEAMACLFNINLRRRLSRNSSTISDTKTTDVKEYFMPDNHYRVNYSEGDKRQYNRLPQVARDVTYYY